MMSVKTPEQCAPMSIVAPSPTPTLSRRIDGADADLPSPSTGLSSIAAPIPLRRPSGQSPNSQVHSQPLTPLTTSQVNQAAPGKSPLKPQVIANQVDMVRSPAGETTGSTDKNSDKRFDARNAEHQNPVQEPNSPMKEEAPDTAPAAGPLKSGQSEQKMSYDQQRLTLADQSQHLSSPPSTVLGEGGSSDTENKQAESRQHSPRQGLGILLGPSFNNFPVNNETLSEALRYRTEQERTKQEYYRLEHRKRSLDLLNNAIRVGIPTASLPLLFGTPEEARLVAELAATAGQQATPVAVPAAASIAAPQSVQAQASAAPGPPVQIVNYEEQQRSPARYRGHMHRASTSSVPTFGGARASAQPGRVGGAATSPTNIQFHHWRPNQTRDRSNSSPKRDNEKRKSFVLESGTGPSVKPASDQRPRQAPAQAPSSSSNTTPSQALQVPSSLGAAPPIPSPRSPLRPGVAVAGSPASVVAAQNSRRRTMGHARHRSEAAINRHSWYATGRHDEGAAILANMASERSKHDMEYILDMPRANWPQGAPIASPVGAGAQPGTVMPAQAPQGAPIPFPVLQQQPSQPQQAPMVVMPGQVPQHTLLPAPQMTQQANMMPQVATVPPAVAAPQMTQGQGSPSQPSAAPQGHQTPKK